MQKLRKLIGTQDQYDSSWAETRRLQDCLRKLFEKQGYSTIETPVLEPTELFVRKGGGELANKLYSFVDPGGNEVSLRPEYTSSIIRWFLECGNNVELPIRAQYSGSVFRYPDEGEDLREFIQSGVELIGGNDAEADAEVVGLAGKGLVEVGLEQGKIVLGDLGLYINIMDELGLSERARMFVLRHIRQLGDGAHGFDEIRQKAESFHLLTDSDANLPMGSDISGMEDARALELISALLMREEPGSFGQRSVNAVSERLLKKLRYSEAPRSMERALLVVSQIASIRGSRWESIELANRVMKKEGLNALSLLRLESLLNLLEKHKSADIVLEIDFGLARGISYYSGIVFEMVDATSGMSLGGGGRYDGLARALGATNDTAALGFAFNIDRAAKVRPR